MKLIQSLLALAALAGVAAAPAAAQTNVGVFNEERVILASSVGQHIAARMQEIEQEIAAELTAIGQPIQLERDALSAETASMTPAAVQARPDLMQRIEALNVSAQQFEGERQRRLQEMSRTRDQAMRPVYEALSPILQETVEARGLDILIERANLVYASPDVDISDDVIARLNEQLPTVPVNRVRLPQEPAAAPQ